MPPCLLGVPMCAQNKPVLTPKLGGFGVEARLLLALGNVALTRKHMRSMSEL